ncbi:uncharacterized protein Dwil_GK24571 [Drosophila willistoni]|uniref:Gustatory receptor n=1 Tax=Drosophila willistoni TaxID=7260 RepID=B4N0F6_DROWI|nr:gustatory receptor 23a [Drosophila willistoni]EDW77569.1 uncharacterized protein Dwil_GK24571 [Drosophila willistoni]
MNSLACLTRRFLQASYCLWALVPLPSSAKIYSFIAFIALRVIWILYFSYMLSRGIGFLYSAKKVISAFVGTFLFLGNNVVGLLLIFESILKRNVHYHLDTLRLQSELLLQRLGMSRGRRIVSFRLLLLISLQLVCDAVRTWANHKSSINPIHGLSMPMIWLLRMRYIQMLQHVMDLNQRSVQLRCSLLALASGNDLWQPYGLQECRQLQTLRLSYERIFECYEAFSDCYGWGILGLQLITGFEFISNAYWMLEAWMSANIVIVVFIYNAATTLSMGSLIIALFWYGDAGAENGRQIGCLISKLIKPLASKRYNNLVCEFSLQTLHQRFVITAKDFFSLNLHLLSSMFAAVVTYLVILIQFMFAESTLRVKDN